MIYIIFACCSCKGFDSFYKHDQFNRITEKRYLVDDIYINYYYLCCYSRQRTIFEDSFNDNLINEDSVANLVLNKIKGLDIHLVYDSLSNAAIDRICHKETLRLKYFLNGDELNNLQIDSKGKRVLVPVLNITDLYMFTGYMTSNFVPGDGGFMNFTSLSLMIFIIEDNEVIFADHIRYASKRTMANSLDEVRAIPPALEVNEEHIEELVRRAMKRYIKKLEK